MHSCTTYLFFSEIPDPADLRPGGSERARRNADVLDELSVCGGDKMVRDADGLVLTNTATAESRSFVVLPLSSLIGGSPVESVCLAQTTTLKA